MGTAFEHDKELNEIINKNHLSESKIQIFKGLKKVAETMNNNDLIFVSPGLSFFEALTVGIPVLSFHQNEFQYNAWKGFIPTIDKTEVHMLA